MTYNDTFFRTQATGSKRSSIEIVPFVMNLLPVKTVLDIGCGTGTWLSTFTEEGVLEVTGVDGDYVDTSLLAIPEERFIRYDLTHSLELGTTFDLVVSLEVAEHLSEEYASAFVQTLVRHGDVILFSAAIPFQGGRHHVNEQWQGYWAKLFAEHDYIPVDCIRKPMWENENVQWWYAQNTFVYVKRSRLHELPLLEQQHLLNPQPILNMVHPKLYLMLSGDFYGKDGYQDGSILKEFTPRI
ncbi:class I SAM-dependent methyltransferase [Paenibacillus gansuensis]|uniref:Class I SAM-dependent methyltransferase n=1 Tax=Paenibacillus gansuensis TaxID=306542 RepID=A0ABW5PKB4_9BACL